MPLPLHLLLVIDESLPGARETARNAAFCAEWIARASPSVSPKSVTTQVLPFSTLACKRDALRAAVAALEPCNLLLYINGHSRLWRGADAARVSAAFGTPTLYARDGSTERISALVYRNRVVLAPIDIKRALDAIPQTVARTLFFIDTCHSMSLVSVLLVPPIDIRIIHSSADDERTWQHSESGSLMSHAWASVLRTPSVEQEAKRGPKTLLWTVMRSVASALQMQLLTSGPGQAFTFY